MERIIACFKFFEYPSAIAPGRHKKAISRTDPNTFKSMTTVTAIKIWIKSEIRTVERPCNPAYSSEKQKASSLR